MRRRVAILLGMGLVAACAARSTHPSLAAAKAESEKSLPIPEDLSARVRESIELGVAIYLQDKVSAIGTDVLLEKLGSPEGHGLGGYITVRDGTEEGEPLPSWQVNFFTAAEPPAIKYVVHVPMEREKTPSMEERKPPERMSEPLLALVRARQAALKAAGPFTQAMNPVVVPAVAFGREPDDILVELLAGTNESNTIVLGKHFRVIVSGDGRGVQSVMPLSKTALVLSTRDAEGNKIVAMYASHVVTGYPLETHVFASLWAKLPLYLLTSRGTWLIDGERITLISTEKLTSP